MATEIERDAQRRQILDQFTRQAQPFREMPAHSNQEAFQRVLDACQVSPTDRVLDVACGPGLTACEFATRCQEVTGIDLTPEMIEQARSLQQEKGLTNLSWNVGDVRSLPFEDESFTLVFTRYSFHHLLEPEATLAEMARVCTRGGRVVVVDVFSSSPEQGEAYDHVEKLRDPSHVHALGLDAFDRIVRRAGLEPERVEFDKLDVGLEELIRSSFPVPGGAEQIRAIFRADLGQDQLGVGAYEQDGEIRFAFPLVILAATRPT